MGMNKPLLLRAEHVYKEYSTGGKEPLKVLRGVDLDIFRGEIDAVVGPSGSGKSTLLHLLGGLDRPTQGKIVFDGQEMFAMSEKELASFRNRAMGFIFQFHHLLPEFSALENVLMPAMIGGKGLNLARSRAVELLNEVGLGERLDHRPNELSGGEQQRVAVARALMNQPAIVLADEPSGNLDEENGVKLHNLLVQLAEKHGLTFVIATHNPDLTKRADRIFRLSEGKLSLVDTPR